MDNELESYNVRIYDKYNCNILLEQTFSNTEDSDNHMDIDDSMIYTRSIIEIHIKVNKHIPNNFVYVSSISYD